MGDLEEESPSDDDNITEIENELYSMFYYHSVSDGIPDDLAEKYNVDVDDFGATISLKQPMTDFPVEDVDEEYKSNADLDSSTCTAQRYIDRRDNCDNSTSDVQEDDELSDFVKLPVDSNKSNVTPGKSRYFQDLVDTCSSPGDELINIKRYDSGKKVACNQSSKLFQFKPEATRSVKNNKKVKSKVAVEVIDLTGNDFSSKPRQITSNKKNRKNSPIVNIISDSESEGLSSNESDSDSYTSCDSSDDGEVFDNILLNTNVPLNKDYCDTSIINTNYNWRLTSSPEGWTKSMRKYYNKPSRTLLTFDNETILQKIRSDASADWSICRADYFNIKSPRRVRCLRCQQEGHVKAKCTKIFSCHMCGTAGHMSHKCPDKMCLKCGSKHRQSFVTECQKCTSGNGPICNMCGVQGHIAKLCTNAWRSFITVNNADKKVGPKYCCHCGDSGHVYEDCNRLHGIQHKRKQKGIKNKKNANLRKNKPKKRTRAVSESNLQQGHHTVFPSHKKAKYRDFGRNINPGKAKFICLMSKASTNEMIKNRQLSKRIMMLRNSKKKKAFNQRRSTPF